MAESLAKRKAKPVPGLDSFIKALTPDQQREYEEIFDALMVQQTLDNQKCFVTGFKIAARLILEYMKESDK